MNLKSLRLIDNITIDSWVQKVSTFTEEDWQFYEYRQKTFREQHGSTLTIPLIFDESFKPGFVNKRDSYTFFEPELKHIADVLTKIHGEGLIVRAIITKLLKHSNIPRHADTYDSLVACRRHHLPIITNEKVLFTVADDTKNLKVGELWEINNTAFHSVTNDSNQDRVHLIVDWEIK